MATMKPTRNITAVANQLTAIAHDRGAVLFIGRNRHRHLDAGRFSRQVQAVADGYTDAGLELLNALLRKALANRRYGGSIPVTWDQLGALSREAKQGKAK